MASCSVEGLQDLLGRAGLDTPVPNFPGSDMLHNPQDVFKVYLADALEKTIQCDRLAAYDAIQPPNMTGMGDLVVVSPKLRLNGVDPKELKKLVVDLATKLPSGPPLTAPIADGVQLRVMPSGQTLARLVPPYILHRKASYGFNDVAGLADAQTQDGLKKKIVIEYSSPNMASNFAPRHLRSTLVGAFVANLFQGMGWDVVRMNYLGDWGKQIGLLAVGWKKFGSDEEFAKDPLRHLLEVNDKIMAEFRPEQEASKALKAEHKDAAEVESHGLFAERDETFQRLEHGDEEIISLWNPFRDATVERLAAGHARLGIVFDERSGESQVSADSVAEVEETLKEKGVYEHQEDGGWTLDFSKHDAKGLAWAAMRYRDGTSGYLLRDVAAVLDRYKTHAFDKMLYVVEAKQDTHFQRIHKTLELMDRADLSAKIQHVSFGDMTGLNGDFTDCRLLDDYLDKARDLAKQSLAAEEEGVFLSQDDDTLDRLGMSALIAQDLAHKRTGSYPMDAKRMAGFGPNTGVTFQNCYARLASLLSEQPVSEGIDFTTLNYEALETPEYSDLLRAMSQLPEVVSASYKTLESSHLISYLTRLVEYIEIALQEDDEVDWEGKDDAVRARMVLYEAARQVLENAMRLAGMQPCGV